MDIARSYNASQCKVKIGAGGLPLARSILTGAPQDLVLVKIPEGDW
jgi:hypothetical protein